MNCRILVTGADGQVGHELRDLAPSFTEMDFTFVTRNELDISDQEQVNEWFSTRPFEYCINCAAYTAVDKAETEVEAARLVNASAAGNLARACSRHGARFIHISTDYVFDGKKRLPYEEDDMVNPLTVYGASKEEGERQVVQHAPDSLIIRTSWVYSSHGKNFVKTMLRLMKEKPDIGVVSDQYGSPTYAADLAYAIIDIIQKNEKGLVEWSPGIYHYSNHGAITWYSFAQEIKEIMNLSCTVKPITTEQYPTPARRPAYSVLSTEKIQRVYGVEIKEWDESLRKCLRGQV